MKKNKLIMILGILLFILIGISSYKIICYEAYKTLPNELISDYNKMIIGLNNQDNVTIKIKDSDSYIAYHNLSIRDDFSNFVVSENLPPKSQYEQQYTLYNEKNKKIAMFSWGIDKNMYMPLLLEKYKNNEKFYNRFNQTINNYDIEKFIKENNVKNDFDLLDLILSEKLDNNSIFTNKMILKNRYVLAIYALYTIFDLERITFINGDYTGYIFSYPLDYKLIFIIKDNIRYTFSFEGLNYFTDEYIYDLLSTLKIENS